MRPVVCAVLSLFLPGLADGVTGRYRTMAMWIVATAGVAVLSALSIWFLPMTIAIRIAAMIEAFRQLRAADRAGVRTNWLGVLLVIGLQVGLAVGLRAGVAEGFKAASSSMAPTLEIGDSFLVDKLTPLMRGVSRGDVIVFRQPCRPDHDFVMRVIALPGEAVEIRCDVVHVNGAPLAASLVQGQGCSYQDRFEGDDLWRTQACSEYAETAGARAYLVYHDAERPARDASQRHDRSDTRAFPRVGVPPAPPSCASEGAGFDAPAETNQQPGTIVDTRSDAAPCDRQRHYVVPTDHVFVLGDNRPNSNDSRFWGAVPIENIRGRVTGIYWSTGPSGAGLARFGSTR